VDTRKSIKKNFRGAISTENSRLEGGFMGVKGKKRVNPTAYSAARVGSMRASLIPGNWGPWLERNNAVKMSFRAGQAN